MKILIVDDQEAILDILTQMIVQIGHIAISTTTASEALTLIKKELPDVGIFDLMLGENSTGYDLAEIVRQDYPLTCLIAISGYVSEYEFMKCRRAGFDCVCQKPITMDELEHILGRAGECVERWGKFKNGKT